MPQGGHPARGKRPPWGGVCDCPSPLVTSLSTAEGEAGGQHPGGHRRQLGRPAWSGCPSTGCSACAWAAGCPCRTANLRARRERSRRLRMTLDAPVEGRSLSPRRIWRTVFPMSGPSRGPYRGAIRWSGVGSASPSAGPDSLVARLTGGCAGATDWRVMHVKGERMRCPRFAATVFITRIARARRYQMIRLRRSLNVFVLKRTLEQRGLADALPSGRDTHEVHPIERGGRARLGV